MPETTLKKYKNRRLYDLTKSCYVTVEEVRRRLIDGEKVLDQEGGDVTVDVLINLIQSDCRKGRPGLTAEALRKFLRSYLT